MTGLFYGRIIKGVGGSYEVSCGDALYCASAAGVFRKKGITPVIGDYCRVSVSGEAGGSQIVQILERKNELIRPRVSNIDQIIVVMAANEPKLDKNLLDKYLVFLEDGNFEIVICINKRDILSGGNESRIMDIKRLYEGIGYKVILMSAVLDDCGGAALRDTLRSKVSALAGPSGAGKSSIVNLLSGSAVMQTGRLSKKISRGKHTTRHVELISLHGGAFVVDTPGFSSVSLDNTDLSSLERRFIEFKPFLGKCAFRDCTHTAEPGCSVKEAAGGVINAGRYNNYLKFYSEIKGGFI